MMRKIKISPGYANEATLMINPNLRSTGTYLDLKRKQANTNRANFLEDEKT